MKAVDEGGTFLEEFVDSIQTLPYDVKRNFDLMRDLDKDSIELIRELTEAEKKYVTKVKRRVREKGAAAVPQEELQSIVYDPEAVADVTGKRQRARQKVDEKVAIAHQTLSMIEGHIRKLDSDLQILGHTLRNTGEFQSTGAEIGDEVAVMPDLYDKQWILGKVMSYNQEVGYYQVADADDAEDKVYSVPESQVIVLDLQMNNAQKLSKGEEVLAVYPDTTSFYTATVTQAPRRTAGTIGQQVQVQFHDDADEFGMTPVRTVTLSRVIRAPT